METFNLNIVSDTKTVFSGIATYCGVITDSGSMGFEAFHEPFLAVLKENTDVTYTDKSDTKFSVTLESGLFSFRNNTCIITGILLEK